MTLIPISRASGNQLDDNMIPLINIVFLMLIFFMIAGQLSSEPLKIQAPTSQQQSTLQEHDAILFVSAKGRLALNDVFLEVSALTEILKQKIAETNDIQSFKLLVKADAAVPASELTDLLKQVRAAGVLKVSLATQTQTSRND